jgi:hypothetical protein
MHVLCEQRWWMIECHQSRMWGEWCGLLCSRMRVFAEKGSLNELSCAVLGLRTSSSSEALTSEMLAIIYSGWKVVRTKPPIIPSAPSYRLNLRTRGNFRDGNGKIWRELGVHPGWFHISDLINFFPGSLTWIYVNPCVWKILFTYWQIPINQSVSNRRLPTSSWYPI